jgi:ABC-type transporter Mla maintaining outer membrane lipid asymmetry ATPase subunit MlaF
MGDSPVVETSALCRSSGDRDAGRQLDLTISPGEIFGLLGPHRHRRLDRFRCGRPPC